MSAELASGDPPRGRDLLARGLSGLQLTLGPEQRDTLLRFVALLAKWNRVYSLTAVRTPEQMVTRHLLDALSVTRWVAAGPVLDVGSGAGLPGLVLAVALPKLRFVLLDSNPKKTRFCLQAVAELGLGNVDVVCERLGDHRPPARYGTLLSRAVGPVHNFLPDFCRLSRPDGQVLVMLGKHPGSEHASVAPLRECAKVMPLSVPGVDAERHLLVLNMACVLRRMGRLEGRG